ncbi:hypothetical protein [Microbacterium sp. K24]|uniref:hypothetical protein n=1 Tax=Microbacterium sp. K24 TaxID=2305446 RepID=UPI00109C3820|nr:hypothetical protein [Microbacterium sp. K24]
MTNMSIPSVTTDAHHQCIEYAWCELDHTDPDIASYAPDTHEKHLMIQAGDASERFLLEVRDGVPRIECSLFVDEVWREPGEPTDSLRNLSDVLATASKVYDEFVRGLTPSLKRSHAVTHELANRDV